MEGGEVVSVVSDLGRIMLKRGLFQYILKDFGG